MLSKLCTAALLMVCFTAAATARPARDNEMVYFKNNSMSEVVGTFYMACNGAVTRTGVTTRHYARYQEACNGVSNIGPNCYVDGAAATCTPEILRFLRRK